MLLLRISLICVVLLPESLCDFQKSRSIEYVPNCPSTAKEWDVAAERKNCSSILKSSQDLAYHCLVNEFRNATLEVCAPSWYLQGFCPVYDTFEHKVKNDRKFDCTQVQPPCPLRFISTESYKYVYCYNISKPTSNNSSPSEDNRVAIGVGIGASILFIVVVVAAAIYVRHRRRTTKETPGIADTCGREDHADSNISNENDTMSHQKEDHEETKHLLKEPEPESLEIQVPENALHEKTTIHKRKEEVSSAVDLATDLDIDGPAVNETIHHTDPNHDVSACYVQNVGTRPKLTERLSQNDRENTPDPAIPITLQEEFADLEVDVCDNETDNTVKEEVNGYTTKHDTAGDDTAKHDTAGDMSHRPVTHINDKLVNISKQVLDHVLHRNPGNVTKADETELEVVPDFSGVISIRDEKRQKKNLGHTIPLGTVNIKLKMNTKSESFHERLSNMKSQHDKIEERIKDLLKHQSGLQGQVNFIELTVECLERIMCELEKDNGFPVSRCRQTCIHGNLGERVTELQNRVSTLINKIEKAEPRILSSTLSSSSSTLLESQVSGDSGNFDMADCSSSLSEDKRNKEDECNLAEEIERLEDTIQKIEERLFALNEAGLGIDGSIKALREKIRCTENVIKLSENKCGLLGDTMQLTPVTNFIPDQLDNLDRILAKCCERLIALEPLLLH